MSLFSTILDKLGLGKNKDKSAASAPGPVAAPSKPAASSAPATTARPATPPAHAAPAATSSTAAKPAPSMTPAMPAAAPAPKAISEVDVVKQLEQKAKGTGLNWKVSIVDLLTLLDIDHSREARNELAKELGCPPELMSDSARMNTWLHKTVLTKIAENGGNIPQNLLD